MITETRTDYEFTPEGFCIVREWIAWRYSSNGELIDYDCTEYMLEYDQPQPLQTS